MNASDYLNLTLLGFLVGAAGQCGRAVVGLKKTTDEATAAKQTFAAVFDGRELLVSIVIGGVAGILAAVFSVDSVTGPIEKKQLFLIAGAGYAGADFIEGMFRNASSAPLSQVGGSLGTIAPPPAITTTVNSPTSQEPPPSLRKPPAT